MTTTGRLRRSAPALLLLAALAGGCAGGDVVGTVPPTDGPHPPTDGPAPPGPPVPTDDEVLDVSPGSLDLVDGLLSGADASTPALTLDEIRTLEEAVIAGSGHDVVLGVNPEDTSERPEWTVWSTDGVDMGVSDVPDADLSTVLAHETLTLDDEYSDGDADAIEVITGWEVTVSEAVERALALRPGEVVVAMPPDEPASILLVGVRADDGIIHRVGIDTVTGEVLNVVVPREVHGCPESGADHCQEPMSTESA